jgi:RHH-type proline utilization regulon transcriptional repressor/proline dehydrogenase/delta 1-pyrroline-5-carboxylate dehydrogenase
MVDNRDLNDRIVARGTELFARIAGEKPSLFDRSTWTGKIMELAMRNEEFKVQLFRFVDVFPSLATSKQLTDHLREYFGEVEQLPQALAGGARALGMFGTLGGTMLGKALTANIEQMARQFIVGAQTGEALRTITALRRAGFAAVVDVLGEATLTEDEAEAYIAKNLQLLDELAAARENWRSLPGSGDTDLDWGHAAKIQIAVKPSALYARADPQDFEGSVQAICRGLERIYHRVLAVGGFLCIDMENYRLKGIILESFRRLRLAHRDQPNLGVVLQTYLKDTDQDLAELLNWARQNATPISIRLVKGAYWDVETVRARQNGWDVPVRTSKAGTDAAFERQARLILENHPICHFACATHNIRSIAAVIEQARELAVPAARYEFQLLFGMAEPVRTAILEAAGRVRLYCPCGALVPGMGYLVRRLLENTANESFLRQSFTEGQAVRLLLENPAEALMREPAPREAAREALSPGAAGLPRFVNEPQVDFTRRDHREAFPAALAELRQRLGATCPLVINGREIITGDTESSVNPARPTEVLGVVCQAGVGEVEAAIAAARSAFPGWRATAPRRRAEILLRAASAARRRIFELAAWQVLEIGKQWDQAYADVAEAIDFMEYYAREMLRLAEPLRLGQVAGELNHYDYHPRGVAAVIAPWNFPLAISAGMVAAALVTGNCVVYKPSGLTPLVGWQLVELFRVAGLPDGVFNYTPGRSAVMGDFLVDHPDIALVAFTGSLEVGLRIVERAARVHPGQAAVKRVVCEMGGKNAIIVDDDADLDEVIPQVLASAFAFQGQKCSACSRVIVLDGIHDRFVDRLVQAARTWRIGPAEDPAFSMGAVADAQAVEKILDYIGIGSREGRLLYRSATPAEGHFVPLTIIGDVRPEHRLAQEEVFGPVLAVMRAGDFTEALNWANGTRFALTGGVFSRSPEHLARARREFRVGNLYLNRGVTGALVGRQPFGGARLSGGGTKAGGPDYLRHFMDPRVVTENTMRRGFTPHDVGQEQLA